MTRTQFAFAVAADEKWVENSARLLGRRLKYTPVEAMWLGLVWVFNQDVGLPLARSNELALEALGYDPHTRVAVLGGREGSVAGISVDVARYHSTYAASLSAAIEIGGAKRRGRPRPVATKRGKRAALECAARYGVDIDLLLAGLRLPVAERLRVADENAAFVMALRPATRVRA